MIGILEECLKKMANSSILLISPPLVLHITCRNNGSFFLDQILGKPAIFLEDMYELQHPRSCHAYQTEFRQIYQTDCRNH